ncbi:TPA: uroporphyrinogen-III synthase [Photobacterium damselae]
MTILVTRPSPDGEQLAHQLCAVGLTAIHQPLLAITSGDEVDLLISQLNWLKSDDFLIAVSDHAVKLAHNYLQSQGASWPKNVHYMAVGHKTAATLAKVTGQSVLMPQHRCDSEGLLALSELQQIRHRRVLILRGNGGRELIRQELIARHAEVHYCETYQRCWLPLDGTTLADSWQQQQVDKLVVTSGEQLAFLHQLVPQHNHAWFLNCHLFVPSQRIADQASQLGFTHISTVGSASNQALFTFLSNMSTMG